MAIPQALAHLRKEWKIENKIAYMLAILILIGVLDLVEIVFVELADEAGEVGMLEHAGEDGFREFVHILGKKAI